MAKIVIIGAGAMGTAFAYPCIDKNHDVSIVGTHLENNVIDGINKNRFHSGLDTKIIDKIKFFKYDSIKEVFHKEADLIVVGVNSRGIDWISKELKKVAKDGKLPNLLMLTKGLSINAKKYELLVDKLERLLSENGIKNINLSAVAGPCLAKGLANRVHSSVIIANKNLSEAKSLAKLLATDYYHTTSSSDMNGVEVCAAIKNIFSMIIGAATGLNKNKTKESLYLNTSAALIKQSIYEMEVFTEFLKGKKETVKGLAGLGDLYVSAAGGRNSKMGSLLGKGMIFSSAKKDYMPDVTVEGAELIFEIGHKIKEDFDIKKIPLMISMINTILDDKKLEIEWNYFT